MNKDQDGQKQFKKKKKNYCTSSINYFPSLQRSGCCNNTHSIFVYVYIASIAIQHCIQYFNNTRCICLNRTKTHSLSICANILSHIVGTTASPKATATAHPNATSLTAQACGSIKTAAVGIPPEFV